MMSGAKARAALLPAGVVTATERATRDGAIIGEHEVIDAGTSSLGCPWIKGRAPSVSGMRDTASGSRSECRADNDTVALVLASHVEAALPDFSPQLVI